MTKRTALRTSFLLAMASLLFCASPRADEPKREFFDPESFLARVSLGEIQNVDEFVKQLPDYFKKNGRFTLAHGSHGLIPSSFNAPNVFLYGSNLSHTVIVYSSTPNPEKRPEKIELITYNWKALKHELFEVSFQAGQLPVVEKNPSRCVRCHGENSAPLWHTGYRWPGFFGEFAPFSETGRESRQKQWAFETFLKRTNEITRLREIDWSSFRTGFEDGSNLDLGIKLTSQSGHKIAWRLKLHPEYAANKNAIVRALSLCEPDIEKNLNFLARFGIERRELTLTADGIASPPDITGGAASRRSTFENGSGTFENGILAWLYEADERLHEQKEYFFPGYLYFYKNGKFTNVDKTNWTPPSMEYIWAWQTQLSGFHPKSHVLHLTPTEKIYGESGLRGVYVNPTDEWCERHRRMFP